MSGRKLFDFVKHCATALQKFIYPPICLHCEKHLDETTSIFCAECFDKLELIDPLERCPYCFTSDYCPERRVCEQCIDRSPVLNRMASSLDYIGPSVSLVRAMKYANQLYLARGAAAFLAAQLSQLDWPFPDVIVPVPMPISRWMQRGYNQSDLIAQQLARLIDRPLCRALRRSSGDFSQAGLNRLQRLELNAQSFQLTRRVKLEDQCILLVDDVLTTGSTLRCCGEVLLEGCPQSIYGLTVCRAIT